MATRAFGTLYMVKEGGAILADSLKNKKHKQNWFLNPLKKLV